MLKQILFCSFVYSLSYFILQVWMRVFRVFEWMLHYTYMQLDHFNKGERRTLRNKYSTAPMRIPTALISSLPYRHRKLSSHLGWNINRNLVLSFWLCLLTGWKRLDNTICDFGGCVYDKQCRNFSEIHKALLKCMLQALTTDKKKEGERFCIKVPIYLFIYMHPNDFPVVASCTCTNQQPSSPPLQYLVDINF